MVLRNSKRFGRDLKVEQRSIRGAGGTLGVIFPVEGAGMASRFYWKWGGLASFIWFDVCGGVMLNQRERNYQKPIFLTNQSRWFNSECRNSKV